MIGTERERERERENIPYIQYILIGQLNSQVTSMRKYLLKCLAYMTFSLHLCQLSWMVGHFHETLSPYQQTPVRPHKINFQILIHARPSENGPPRCILFHFEKKKCVEKILGKKSLARILKIQNMPKYPGMLITVLILVMFVIIRIQISSCIKIKWN